VPRILSQSGVSLADLYDIKGSIVGVEQLTTREISLVHEMGDTLFSERLSSNIQRGASGDIAQTLPFDVVLTGLPMTPFRVLGIMVFADAASRVSTCQVSLRDPLAGREVIIWSWQSTVDSTLTQRVVDDGGAAANVTYLRPVAPLLVPTMGFGTDQPQSVSEISMRGNTLTFGAGTVETFLLVHIAFSEIKGISSYGLSIPSW